MRGLAKRLQQDLYRVECMDDPGHMNKKIKEAQHAQIPFMLIAGDREAAEGTVAVRRRGTREQVDMKFEDFVAMIERLRASKSLDLGGTPSAKTEDVAT